MIKSPIQAMLKIDLPQAVEALIFSADKPISLDELAKLLDGEDPVLIEKAILTLNKSYEDAKRSFCIRRVAGGYLFATNQAYYPLVRKLYQKQREIHLTPSAMEVLAIIAYHQPITRAQIDEIRGVSCIHHIHNLLEMKLIRISGKLKTFGRPLLYGTTHTFLKYFGLNTLEDLPNYNQIKELTVAEETAAQHNNSIDDTPNLFN